jgi:hypothetical protein
LSDVKLHIGVAHGSVEGLSPDPEELYYPMARRELEMLGLDLWLLGHTHLPFPHDIGSISRVFLAGTPEPDGFRCTHQGQVWLIQLSTKSLEYEPLSTGLYSFQTIEQGVDNEEDVRTLEDRLTAFDSDTDLIQLRLRGTPDRTLFEQFQELFARFEKSLCYLQADWSGLSVKITPEEIEQEFTSGSFPHRFLTRLSEESDNPKTLQFAYELIQEAKR